MRTLIAELGKMPGIGPKSAQRLAFFILTRTTDEAKRLSDAICKLKENVKFCNVCNNLSDNELCDICSNTGRDRTTLCVVEKPSDVISVEKMRQYNGIYHVLLGALSPLEGVGPKDLKIDELLKRVRREKIREIIIATDSNTEGEVTALYLVKVLKPLGIKLYRIACGMPVGANLEYADQATLYKAFEGKKEV
jgi:recombination protein RecR